MEAYTLTISALLEKIEFKNQLKYEEYLKEKGLKREDIEIEKIKNDGISIVYIEAKVKFIDKEYLYFLSENKLKEIYNESKQSFRPDIESAVIGSTEELSVDLKQPKDPGEGVKIIIDRISNLLNINKLDIDYAPKTNHIIVEVKSNIKYFFDFWWEEVSEKNLFVKRIFVNNFDKICIESDFAVMLVSRGGDNITKDIEQEIKDFFTLSFVESKRKNLINKLFIAYFKEKFVLFRRELSILHIVGHGDEKHFFYENQHTEDDSSRYGQISYEDFLKKLLKKKINIINLSFCFSGYNNEVNSVSLPIMLLDKKITNYVISCKKTINSSFLSKFNQRFYFNFIKQGKTLADAFYESKNHFEDEYKIKYNNQNFKNILSFFERDL